MQYFIKIGDEYYNTHCYYKGQTSKKPRLFDIVGLRNSIRYLPKCFQEISSKYWTVMKTIRYNMRNANEEFLAIKKEYDAAKKALPSLKYVSLVCEEQGWELWQTDLVSVPIRIV